MINAAVVKGSNKDKVYHTNAQETGSKALEEISTQMGLLTIIQIPCHHV